MVSIVATSAAQVVIEMPAPPKPSVKVGTAAPGMLADSPGGLTASTSLPQPDLGDLALRRYARGRTAPYDTYWNGPQYAGIRMYSYSYPYPVFWWGFWPWWGPCVF
jgi:hypothetical protein